MTDNEREVLIELDACKRRGPEWARPMDLGGRDASHHSGTLKRLVAQGLAATRQYGGEAATGPGAWEKTKVWRGARVYRITPEGHRAIVRLKTAGHRAGGGA